MDSAVRHPLVEKIELTSTEPTIAVDFFLQMLHPDPEARMTMAQASRHPYLAHAMQRLLSREAMGSAVDQATSTHDVSASPCASPHQTSNSHSVCMLSSGAQLSSDSTGTSAVTSLSCKSAAPRVHLIWQSLRLPKRLVLVCNVVASILRRFCVSKARQTPAMVSKLPICTQRLQAAQQDDLVPHAQSLSGRLNVAKGQPESSSSSASTSSCASNDSDTDTATTEVDSHGSAPDMR